MKILYIHNCNIVRGSTTALQNIITGVKDSGHMPVVITNNTDGPFLKFLEENNIETYKIPIRLTIYISKMPPIIWLKRMIVTMMKLPLQQYRIKKIIKKVQPDIVHTNVGPLGSAVLPCRHLRIPHVWHSREYQDLDFNMHYFPSVNAFMRLSHSEGNYNVAITEGIFKYRHFREGVDKVVYDGVFSQQQLELVSQKKEKYILYVGRVIPGKSVFSVIKAFADFLDYYKDYKLLIVGEDCIKSQYSQRCHNFILKKSLVDHVVFLGERHDVYRLMAHAKMLIVPSLFEGFGFITAEAMANGCIVVGRNTAGTKEQFDNGVKFAGCEIGYRFNDDEELKDVMLRVMDDDTAEMVEKARSVALGHYTIEKNVSNLLNYYEFVLQDYKSKQGRK